ncbi:serine protease HtrA [Clostridium cochlearium]|uniref:serine protease HtrA n=1 Tax=Clostridium cochlearium TaxID=1494 RepID=UPI001EDD1AFA|nr:trypsin-like peptidase domain-containing protein [Clostridium cochlearium]MBV1820847.1 trypsin-like peptidase domain-containing protein [Bacteroidales bacterium MSK.15.36]MCG4581101.1 trypsin-like peptidase domain-containing protein [Clostridium cochlearium]
MDDKRDLFTDEDKEHEYGQSIDKEDIVTKSIYSYEKVPTKNKRSGFRGSLFSYIALALVAAIIGGVASIYIAPNLYGNILPNPNSVENKYMPQQVSITPSDDINTVSAVVKKSMSSVVGITTLETVNYFFEQRDVEGLGSGVIVDSNGYILTNSHVVADGNAKEIKVLFDNGDKVPGKVLWNDSSLDLAIVKVDITNLPVAELGDSDKLEVGEIAIAIGNPLGLEFQRTVTSGVISGLNRSIQINQANIIEDLIQTDASINPGNSGGPLLNKSGEVIGINTVKIKTGEGLGFSIPINIAKSIIKEVISKGTYETVVMGVRGMDVKDYQARLGIDLGLEKGVVILSVESNSPAEKAGILQGDILIKMDDTEINSMQGLKKHLYNYKSGDKSNLTVIRNGEKQQIEIGF